MRRALLVCAFAALAACANFHAVEDGRCYRVGQLDASDLRGVIDEYGIKTVLRLRGGGPGDPGWEASKTATVGAGISLVEVPMSANRRPSRATLLRLCDVFKTAEYPLLLHCRGGADRSGLASAIYVLERTGDLDAAKRQLHAFPYLHLGWGSTQAMDQVLRMYAPYAGAMDFEMWVRDYYEVD